MFQELNTGQTHYVGDGCNPPHPPLHNHFPKNAVEYWVSEASKGRNVAECWQAIYNIIQAEKENIYFDLKRIADNGEFEDMRREVARFFLKK